MKKSTILLVVIIIILGGFYFWRASEKKTDPKIDVPTPKSPVAEEPAKPVVKAPVKDKISTATSAPVAVAPKPKPKATPVSTATQPKTDTPIPTGTLNVPPTGLFDNEYFDGHADSEGKPTPILPPGKWDWSDANNDLANWRNFSKNIGTFTALKDSSGEQYGWQLNVSPTIQGYSGAAEYFEGSSGRDILDFGPRGIVNSIRAGMADGNDILVFNKSWSLNFFTGSSLKGSKQDDDLVVAGCSPNPDGTYDIMTTTVHTGPGSDTVFIRDFERAAVDLGNGNDGRTDTIDPTDGNDVVVIRGNTSDFRMMGGNGNDKAFWYVDDNVQKNVAWLGPSFFGGGSAGGAVWADTGTDRLILVIDPETPIVTNHGDQPGKLFVKLSDGKINYDQPTINMADAKYCWDCGVGPRGQKTVILGYMSKDKKINTGHFSVNAFEELQLGLGANAKMYKIDDVAGALVPDSSLSPVSPPAFPSEYCS